MKTKQIIILFWKELIYKGHLTAFGATSIVLMTATLLKIKVTWECLVIVYLASEIIYLYNRYKEIDKDFLTNPERTKYFLKHNKHIRLSIFLLSLAFVGVLTITVKINLLVFGVFFVFLGLLYSVFFKKLTKNIIAFKNFFVSFCWATIVIFVSIFYSYQYILPVFLIFVFVWINMFVQEALLDIKDVKNDKRENLLTLPIILSRSLLFYVLFFLTILASAFIFYGIYFHLLPVCSVILFFVIPYNFFLFNENINKININFKYLEALIDIEKVLCGVLIFYACKL